MDKFVQTYIIYSLLACLAFAAGPTDADAQNSSRLMSYEIMPDGDTVFFDVLKPSRIWARQPKQKGREWRKYYRLVYNFSKTYPYSQAARQIVAETDSTIKANGYGALKKERYIKEVEKQLIAAYEKPLRHMTISQGQLLTKLVDREIGRTPYAIIRGYTSAITAGFWQGVAKMFGEDLKKRYDPEGEDKPIEDLIKIWEAGDFPGFYWSIFGEYPVVPVPPSYKK